MTNEITLPGNQPSLPNVPEGFSPVIFEEFAGLNTKPLRPGIQNSEMYICDGFIPFGPNNCRTLYGTGAPIINSIGIQWFGFGNIVDTDYCFVLTANGAMVQVNMTTLVSATVMPPGTITNPTSIMGFSQWGSQYIIFAKDQPNGYWLWDGTNLFTAGTLGPDVTVDNGGQNYTSSPSFLVQTTGTGSGIDLSFQLENGSVSQVTVTNPGSGFGRRDQVVVAITGGGSDTQAIANKLMPTVNTGGIDEVWVLDGGTGYTGYALATVTGTGSGASISLAIQNGTITGAAVVNPGTGYSVAPTITITDPGIPGPTPIPGGSGGSLLCSVAFGQILAINVNNGGSGYVSPPTVTILGDGTGAEAVALIDGGAVVAIDMKAYGSGYTQGLAKLEGGNNAANISVELMPFGISGTSVEVYEGHVWVTNGAAVASFPPQNRTLFSAPDSPVDFGDGGGAFQSQDPFLRIGYQAMRQSNGFLYLIGDSSMNYISGVQTTTPSSSSVPATPVTTFGNLNVDPQIGTPWPGSVQVFSRNIVFANTIGIYVSYGGAVKKVSDPLDGFYSSSSLIFEAGANFTSAVASLFGVAVYMLLLPVIDPFSGVQRRTLLIWDGKKWFTSQQDRALTFITTREIDSVLTAWGTDGTDIFQLFAQPTTGFIKRMQSKLFAAPAYYATKAARSLSGIFNAYNADADLTITIDNEQGVGSGNALTQIPPPEGGAGLLVFGPVPMAQQGRLIGLTVQTQASDLAVLSVMISDQVMVSNV